VEGFIMKKNNLLMRIVIALSCSSAVFASFNSPIERAKVFYQLMTSNPTIPNLTPSPEVIQQAGEILPASPETLRQAGEFVKQMVNTRPSPEAMQQAGELVKRLATSQSPETIKETLETAKQATCWISPEMRTRLMFLAAGSAAGATVAGYMWVKKCQAEQQVIEAEEKRAIQEARNKKAEEDRSKIASFMQHFNELYKNDDFKNDNNGFGFNGWFFDQQKIIVKLTSSQALRMQAMDPHGAFATIDASRYFGYIDKGNPFSRIIYTFTIDTPRSIARLSEFHGQEQAAQAQRSTPAPSALEGQELAQQTAQLNPPLILTFRIIHSESNTITSEIHNLELRWSPITYSYEVGIYEDMPADTPVSRSIWQRLFGSSQEALHAPTSPNPKLAALPRAVIPEPKPLPPTDVPPVPAPAPSSALTQPAQAAPARPIIINTSGSSGSAQPATKPWWRIWQ
jgi:hypothetical protein